MRIEDIVNNPEASMTLHMDYQDHLYEQEWMMATQDYDALVNSIFSHGFAKLKDISIGGSSDNTLGRLYAYERSHSHPLLVNGKMECSSSLLPGVWRSQHDQLTRASAAIIRSLARNNVEAFQVHDLTLQLSNGTNDSHPSNWTTSRGRDILMRALDALSSLQGLSLAPTRSEIFDCDFTRHVLQHCPPRLKRFRLHDFAVERQALSDFIDQRRSTLRFLGFTRAHLLRELWRPLILKLYRIGIPSLEIGFLYELSEESYRIIQFPALPRGQGAVPNDMGSFENGRWRVGQRGEEFFLQLSVDNPMDEYKVQAGLSHILRNGSRPEYRWVTSMVWSLGRRYGTRHEYGWATRVAWLDTKEMFVAPKYETFAMRFFGVSPFRRILALRGRSL
ncbi:hypothetical protein SLS58_000759 [Diplodia intermedia]|uniref:Uncharacterized protein n=1 Tax=Diplodia intermedia TaxID=856260 RepID=A0ABR3U4D8_9PEZI